MDKTGSDISHNPHQSSPITRYAPQTLSKWDSSPVTLMWTRCLNKGLRAPRRKPRKFAINLENARRIFRGYSFALYQCARNVQDLKTRIEIWKEEQWRNFNLMVLERQLHGPCLLESPTFILRAPGVIADAASCIPHHNPRFIVPLPPPRMGIHNVLVTVFVAQIEWRVLNDY
ncbi:hypothetical protein C8J57DRAFT_1219174 [Mycena rebaudengoi]|nr:hypothetical protein C8J57DRAFT_1219174 [Mycena rebaudengoi]